MQQGQGRAGGLGFVGAPAWLLLKNLACASSVVVLALVFSMTPAFADSGDSSVVFERDIEPILESRCVSCHGAQEKSGLRLDSEEAFRRGGDGGAVFAPGKSAESRLIQYVSGHNEAGIVMPPQGDRLTEKEIALLRAWIDQGASWPQGQTIALRDERSDHWAFQPVVRPELPPVADSRWGRNAIDQFVLARLEREGVAPSEEADRTTLIRRLSLDLRGLPPTLAEVDEFVSDASSDAYGRLVGRFLASPQYGERWGRHWLDVARYADSEGDEGDIRRPIWKYRDWVVDAMNRDMPFDTFTIEQIAGDLLPDATVEQKVATGFHRTSLGRGNTHPQVVIDRVNATGTAFLGLTIGCAQCHSHKFDPISQREFYQLYAFFNNMEQEAKVEFATAKEIEGRDAIVAKVGSMKQELTTYEKTLASLFPSWEAALTRETMETLRPEMKALLSVAADKRSEKQVKSLLDWFKEMDPGFQQRKTKIDVLAATEPKFISALITKERMAVRVDTHIFVRGVFENKGATVQPGVPRVLPAIEVETPTRLDFARWLVSKDNPLTPRVAVNRIWQRYFGVGLVEATDNFGVQGDLPSHPQLLDWLASAFRDGGWSLKRLHRLIVSSSTYRQSSRTRPDLQARDPLNRLLARQARLRLEAETIRDEMFSTSGLLSLRMGGPSVHPYQVEGVMTGRADKTKWVMGSGEDIYRRGLYVHFWRLTPHPFLRAFDAPDSTESCARRQRTNTPIQALTALNDPWFVECGLNLAENLLRDVSATDEGRLRRAFQLCVARVPSARELEILGELLVDARCSFTAEPSRAVQLCASISWATRVLEGDAAIELAAWTEVSRALLNLDEFINRE